MVPKSINLQPNSARWKIAEKFGSTLKRKATEVFEPQKKQKTENNSGIDIGNSSIKFC